MEISRWQYLSAVMKDAVPGACSFGKIPPAPQFPEINFTLGNFLIALLSRSDCPSFPKLFPFTSCSFL
jgi:hypothetical protein